MWAVQFGTVRGDPTQSCAGWPVCMPPWLPSAPTGKRASRTTTAPTCGNTSPAWQVGTSVKENETVHHQTTLHKAVDLKNFLIPIRRMLRGLLCTTLNISSPLLKSFHLLLNLSSLLQSGLLVCSCVLMFALLACCCFYCQLQLVGWFFGRHFMWYLFTQINLTRQDIQEIPMASQFTSSN